jgi:hypothetical protein
VAVLSRETRGPLELARSTLSPLLLAKVREQVERTQHLLGLVPRDKRSWRPDLPDPVLTLGGLLGHILECHAGLCAALYCANPERLAHFLDLKDLPVNHSCDAEEASGRISSYLGHIEEGFTLLSDEQLSRVVPTLFVPEGEALFTILLGNLEHLINHKYQLFVYLKMLGVRVTTPDLYWLRGRTG